MLEFIPRNPKKVFRLEEDFQLFIRESIMEYHGEGWPYHKMSDQSLSEKPCDCFYIDEWGETYFMELKVIEGYTLNIKRFEPQQVEFLTKVSSLQSDPNLPKTRALVLVYSKKLQRWRHVHWWEVESELLNSGSVQIFNRQ